MTGWLNLALAGWLLLASLGGGLAPWRVADRDAHDAVQRAIAWLHTQQCSDGSFGFRRPDGSCQPSASVTADVVYVLALVGEKPDGPAWTPAGGQSALGALAKLAPTYVYSDAGQAGKVARAVALAGGNPRDVGGLNLISIIRSAYDPATGRFHRTLLYRHTMAIEGLLRAGELVPSGAYNALIRAQLPDGSWFWSFDGAQGDVDTTGRVMQLLGGQAYLGCLSAYDRGAAYLTAAQTAAGGWGVYPPPNTNPPNANSTALVIAGLRAAGYDPQAAQFQRGGRGALDTLLSFQATSGAFVYIQQTGMEESRLMATVDALNALMQPLVTQPRCRSFYLPLVIK